MRRIVPEIRLSALFPRLRALASRFKSDRRGNVAVITAIAALPMISAIGCVIDYSNAIDDTDQAAGGRRCGKPRDRFQ